MLIDANAFTDTLSYQEMIFRILMAVVLAGLIGFERGRNRNRPAGFRTHILVCVGAASISLLEDQLRVEMIKFAAHHQELSQFFKTDLSRLGAQVITGIGFLGAGTIIRDKATVGGLTTAASLWATGCLGLIIGWGFYTMAIIVGAAIITVLVVLKGFEKVVYHKSTPDYLHYNIKPYNSLRIEISLDKAGNFQEQVQELYTFLEQYKVRIKEYNTNPDERKVYFRLHFNKEISSTTLLKELVNHQCITSYHRY